GSEVEVPRPGLDPGEAALVHGRRGLRRALRHLRPPAAPQGSARSGGDGGAAQGLAPLRAAGVEGALRRRGQAGEKARPLTRTTADLVLRFPAPTPRSRA